MHSGKESRATIQEPDKTTSVVSLSLDLQTQLTVSTFRRTKGMTRSRAMRLLIKYGLIYSKMLEDGYFDENKEEENNV